MKIKDLNPAPYNPRTSTQKQEDNLKASLEKFGVVEPIIYNKQTSNIVGGHFRVRELKKLGHKEVDCVIVDLNVEDEKELNIRLNANTGGWDWDELANNWDAKDLEDWGLDGFPFDTEPEQLEAVEDNYEQPEEIKTDIVLGDLFTFSKDGKELHRLLCGDSTKIDDVERLMDGKKADMVFTDPPYNTGMDSKNAGWLAGFFNDNFTDEEWADFMPAFIASLFIAMKDDSVAYISLDWRRNFELIPHIKNTFHLSNIIVWDKMVHGLGSDYKYTYEVINVCKKGKPQLETHQGNREYSDVWHIQRKMGKDEHHATKKPIELTERCVRHGSKEKDSILDIFLGSGTTMIACHQLQRKCYGMELDPKYCQVIVDRMKKLDPEIIVEMEQRGNSDA